MPAPAMTDDGEALHKLVQDISHAWRSGRTMLLDPSASGGTGS